MFKNILKVVLVSALPADTDAAVGSGPDRLVRMLPEVRSGNPSTVSAKEEDDSGSTTDSESDPIVLGGTTEDHSMLLELVRRISLLRLENVPNTSDFANTAK